MRSALLRSSLCSLAFTAAISFVSYAACAQQQPAVAPPAPQQGAGQGSMGGMQHNMNMEEKAAPIADGGIHVPGWKGEVDPNAAKAGQSEKDSRFAKEGKDFHITTGPAIVYWNPKNTASGDYTVSATFNEPKYMNRNDHPHPYGIFIAGSGLGTPETSSLYCAAYGSGTFIVRGFGPAPFQMGGRRPTANDAVHKAAGPGQPVSQKIALQVKGDKVSCIINDVEVASYPKTDVVADGKLKSTDGIFGIRFAHNTDATVSDFKVTKP